MFSNQQINTPRSLLFSLLFFGAALTHLCEPVPAEYKAFFSQDWARQKEEAKGFSLEKQIEYYLAGRKYVHPPSSTLLYVIAQRGKAAIPALVERMKNERSDAPKVALSRWFVILTTSMMTLAVTKTLSNSLGRSLRACMTLVERRRPKRWKLKHAIGDRLRHHF